MNLIVRKLMKLFSNLFKGSKLNANEVAVATDSKYKTLDNYLRDNKSIYESGNNYIKFYDGTMVCYGNYKEVSVSYSDYYGTLGMSGEKTITLPKAFKNTDYKVNTTSCNFGNICALVQSKTTTKFAIRVATHHQFSSYGSGADIDWIAIGKWK